MKFSLPARRVIPVAALACATALLPAVALAAPTHATARTPAAAPGRCLTSQLQVWLGLPGDDFAGGSNFPLELSNVSRHTCTLVGSPGVSAEGSHGQLGSPSPRAGGGKVVTLRPNGTAHVVLTITDVFNFPGSACHVTKASFLRVIPPNDFTAGVVPFSFEACAKKGPRYLHVSPVLRGVGIPNHGI